MVASQVIIFEWGCTGSRLLAGTTRSAFASGSARRKRAHFRSPEAPASGTVFVDDLEAGAKATEPATPTPLHAGS
jgi:hypothetical protein